ncbi:MAG TPA: ATP-binding cassette domain-containing protein, partial [Acidimicrobiales bacterium]|nr:ATP-binding cassette domain-containing protein [Acidimicrobiales bacterium]
MTDLITGKIDAVSGSPVGGPAAGELMARGVCAWFGSRLVLEDVDLDMERSRVTALIGPSGCGKSTFIRTLNRMHEVVPGAQLAGSVELDGVNIYAPDQRANEVRQHIGMVFQRPNPFPAMSIYDNVLSGLRFTRTKVADR